MFDITKDLKEYRKLQKKLLDRQVKSSIIEELEKVKKDDNYFDRDYYINYYSNLLKTKYKNIEAIY